MQEEHRKAIQLNFGSLVEQTDLDLIVSVLYEKGVFSEAMIEPYRDTNKDARMRKRELYRDIERRGPNAFGCLLDALTETGHWDLVRALDPNSVLHPRREHHRDIGPPVHNPDPSYISLKNKEALKNESKGQQSTSAAKVPYPLDFSKLDEASAEIPDLHVIKSTNFHEMGKEGIPLYPTRSRRRGTLLAFSYIEFKNGIEEYRKGAEVDLKNLKYLFAEMGFEVIVYSNLTKAETEIYLNEQRKVSHMRTECVFVVVSSHGYERGRTSDTDIRCSDGRLISMHAIIEQFNNKNFPGLRGVPKVFIFQSCRGSEEHVWAPPRHISPPLPRRRRPHTDGAVCAPSREGSPVRGARDEDAALAPDRLYSDILIAHSTLPGFVSRRDAEQGSWYIQALCEVFAARAHDCDVEQLFKLVDTRLHDKFHSQTSSVDRWGFNKRLYLHPGLFED